MRRIVQVLMTALLLLVACQEASSQKLNSVGVEIHIFNVGQADSTLVIGPPPERKMLLIDAGEEMVGKRTHYVDIAGAISELVPNKKTIDYFVISHYHFDHIGTGARSTAAPAGTKKANTKKGGNGNGLWGLIESSGYRIGKLIDRGDQIQFGPTTGPHDKLDADFVGWKAKGKINQREVAELGSQQIKLGKGVTVEIVAINGNGILERKNQQNPSDFEKCPPSENDYSVALKITYGDFEYYTGGDLAGVDTNRSFGGGVCTSYNDVETSIAPVIGNVEVMKIDHHGSAFSSNSLFLDTLAPEFIVVTSGARNTYQHPSREVMQRAAQIGTVLITGGVSEKEWPGGELLPGMELVEQDVDIYVEAGGKRYEIMGEIHPAFSDAEESAGADRKRAQFNALKRAGEF